MTAMVTKFLANQRVRGLSQRTIERRAWSLGLWVEHVHGDLRSAGVDEVESFLSAFDDAQTRYSIRSDVKQLYRFLVRRGLAESNPVDLVDPPKLPRREPSPIAVDDVLRLVASAVGETRLAIMLYAYAGLRASEIAGLHGEHIDLSSGVLVVRGGKGGKDGTVPIAEPLAIELTAWPTGGPLFTAHTGQAISCRIRKAMRAIGIAGRPHDLRHSFGTEAARHSGGNVWIVKGLMRHASISTTQRYVNYWPDSSGVVDDLYGGDAA